MKRAPSVGSAALLKVNAHAIAVGNNYVFGIKSLATESSLMGFRGKLDASSLSVKLSALRSATALQKYKEIQNSNDPDFAAQVLAHFGIKGLKLILVLLFLLAVMIKRLALTHRLILIFNRVVCRILKRLVSVICLRVVNSQLLLMV